MEGEVLVPDVKPVIGIERQRRVAAKRVSTHSPATLLVDGVLYALAGCFDEERGWGVRGDTFRCNAALALYADDWFHVGDEDLALHLKRTALLRSGRPLSEVTAVLARWWGFNARVLPMSDDPVRTMIVSEEGRLSLQEYVVARQAAP